MDSKKKLRVIKAIIDASDITPVGGQIILKPSKIWKDNLTLQEENDIFNSLEKELVVKVIKNPRHFKHWNNIFLSDYEKSYYLLEKDENFEKLKRKVVFKEEIYEL